MFNVGGGEILVILLLALLVLGPDKLPEYARKAGRYMNEFRRMTSGFQEEFRQAIDLGDSSTTSSSGAPTATVRDDDALSRTSEGPRLPATSSPSVTDAAPMTPPPPSPVAEVTTTAEPVVEPTGPLAADVSTSAGVAEAGPSPAAPDATPAAGGGPELITPSRHTTGRGGDSGSSRAG